MIVIDDYRKGWALRYLREAKVELTAARKAPKMGSSLMINAMKKAQAAIYHGLGDPALIEDIIQQKISEGNSVDEPILRCLVEIERSIQQVAGLPNPLDERSLRLAEDVVSTASEIVNLFVTALRTEDLSGGFT